MESDRSWSSGRSHNFYRRVVIEVVEKTEFNSKLMFHMSNTNMILNSRIKFMNFSMKFTSGKINELKENPIHHDDALLRILFAFLFKYGPFMVV